MSDDSGECSGDEMDLRPSGSEYRERNLSKRRIVMTIDFSTDSDSSENCHNNNYNNNKSICNVGEENTCQQQEKTLTGNSRYIKGKDASRGRLNKLNIVTSDDSSSSDNEIILRPRIRRKPNHQKKSIFDNESDVEKPNCSSLTSVLSATQSDMDGGASDSSSNELLEKCPICLLTFRDQNIGSPSTCQHIFCANCIESWSKNMQTCPIDRLLFDHIIVRVSYKNRKVLREINVVPSQSNVKGQVLNDDLLTQEEGEMEEDVTNCELCHMCDREDVMLLCDRCNRGYHMDCLTPPLTEIPFGSWYCVNCNDSQSESAGEADVAAELSLIIDQMRDAGISENQLQIRRINHPRILRTRQHERIRAVVLRQTRRQKQMNDESQNNGPSRRRYRRRRRRRRITKRRTYVVEYDVNNFNEKFAIKTTKKVIKRRKKVRTIKMSQKSSQLTVKNRPRLSASKRLAEQLGVKKDSTFSSRFSSAGTSLSLFGGSYDLEYFSDECDNDNDNGSIANEVGINAGQTMGVQTAVRIANYDPCRLRKGGYCSKRSSILPQISNRTVDTNFDILSDIINMQDRWNNAMRNINLIHINPDGSLLLPNPSTNNGAKTTTTTCNNEITRDVGTNEPNINRMPLYSQGGGGTNSFGGYQNNYNQNYRRSGGGGGASGGNNHNTNQQRYSTGSSSGTVTGSSNNNMGFNMLDPNANYNTNLGNNTQFSMTNLNRNTFAPFPLRFNQRNKQPANQRQQHNINANNINNSNINNFPNKQRNPSQFINNNRLNNNRLNNNRLNNNRLNNNRFINISMHNSTSSLLPRRSSNLSTYQDPLQMHQTGSLSMETNTLFGGLPPPICSQQPPATSMPCVDNTTTPPVPQLPTMANKLIDSHGLSMGINMGVGGGVGVGTISSNNSLFSGLPPPIRGQTPLTSSIVPTLHNVTLPTPLIMNVPPPPMPPAAVHLNFGNNICNSSNNSLFQLNTNYSNDNDNDSNCPNFSVYSQESQEVAKSTELNQQQQPMATTLHNATNATSIVKEDDDNEDLVQLGDDDDDDDINNNNDIPMPPEPKPTNYEKNKVATKPPECELYEPENPTDELDEDDDNNNGDINDSTNENLKNVDMQENNKESLNEIILLASNDNDEDRQYIAIEKDVNYNKEAKEETEIKTINKSDLSKDLTSNKITIAYRRKESNSPTDEIHKEVNKSKDIDIEKVKDLKSSTSSPSKMATILSQTSDKDLRTTSKGVLDLYDDTYWDEFQIERPKEFTPIDSAASKCTSKKSDDDANHPENIKNDNDDKKSEPDRSYTPCLDENNDLDESISNQIVNVEESLQSKQNVEEPSNTPPKICNKIKQSKTTNEKRSLDNMETELVSEDEYDNDPLESDKFNIKNTSKREKPAKDSIETFKKVSGKQRERNYRGDKQQQSNKRSRRRRRSSRSRGKSLSYSRSRSRSRFRSRTRSRSARAERSRNARSRSLHKRKAKGRSRSRSITNKENRSRFRRDVNRRENYRDVALRSIDQAHKRSKRRALPRYDVRNVVNSAQRSTKDRYGRDTSRQGKSSRSVSRERRHRFSHSRSRSRRRSFSPPPERRNRRLSISLSPSPHPFLRNESITPARRYSPITKRWNSPVNSRRSPFCRRTQTPIRLMRSRSTSSKDSGIGRHKISKHHQEKSPIFSLSRKNIRQKHSPIISPHYTPQISRSPTKSPLIKIKRKKSKDFKKKKTTKRALSSLSPSPHRRLMRQTDTFVEIEKPLRKKDRHHSHSPKMQVTKKHGVIDDEWSPSPSPVPPELSTAYIYPQENNISWTPPMDLPHHNLHEPDTVLFHTDNISRPISACCSPKDKGKRIKKKKKGEKRRGDIRKEKKRKRRTETPDTVPSKEVFASGNNILVSVSFNKDAASSQPQQMPQQQTIVTVPPNREDLLPNRRISIDRLTNSSINNKKRKEKHKKLDAKPIAIIDLERSPFQIQQEPFDVIVLTDSEDNLNDLQREDHQERCRSESCSKETNEPTQHDKSLEHLNTMLEEESYDIPPSQMGPKTPPEPRLVKFNLQSKKQNKVRNPLHDEEDDDDINVSISIEDHRQPQQTQQQQDQHRTDMEMAHVSNSQKIGPNTPPETGPYSPDAYDPFEPTKSPSVSPRFPTPPPQSTLTDVCTSQLSDNNKLIDMSTPQKHVSVIDDTHRDQIPALGGNNNATQGTSSLNPVDLVMALMNTKATANSNQDLVNKSNDSQFSISSSINQHDDNMHDKSDDNNTLTVLSNVLISTSSGQHIPSISSPTPPTISKKNIPMPKLGGSVGGSSSSGANIRNGMAPNTEDSLNLNDIESPYSPGSADYEDLFEPPPDNSGNSRRRNSKRNSCNNSGGGAIAVGKPDVFDNLFGSSSPIGVHTRMSSYTPSKRHNKITNSLRKSKIKVGRSTDDLIKVYDDVPNSAVELQVKDRFLRKLNRQERVVEEVKLVLKPRFNKKQITKEDYKEIMRRAVPKICHSKSGEIDPHKIKNLIEAYVKKFRAKHKKLNLSNTGQVSSAVKCAAYLKKL